jgi:hypothetical protein
MITDLQLATTSRKVSRSGLFEVWIGLPCLDYRSGGWTYVLDGKYNTVEDLKKALETDWRGMHGDYDIDIRCPAAFRARHLRLEAAKSKRASEACLNNSEIPF